MEPTIVKRSEAVRQGLTKYFTGKPCPRGHVCERYTGSRNCTMCQAAACKKWSQNNRDKQLTAERKYRKQNPEKVRESTAKWRFNNLEKVKKKAAEWQKANRSTCNFHDAKRRALKLLATPKWCDMEAIKLFYSDCPKDKQVDHIVPLNSEKVCGLHTIANLQYLTPEDNLKKGNRWWPDMF